MHRKAALGFVSLLLTACTRTGADGAADEPTPEVRPHIVKAGAFRFAAVLALLLGGVACAQPPQSGGPSRQQQQAALPDDPDAFDREIVRQLIAGGSNVTKPARVVYSLYIPSRRDAEAAARELRAAGYRATVQQPVGKLPDGRAETRFWLVASNVAVPSLEHARRERGHLDALARRYHGEYSGWGADLVK